MLGYLDDEAYRHIHCQTFSSQRAWILACIMLLSDNILDFTHRLYFLVFAFLLVGVFDLVVFAH